MRRVGVIGLGNIGAGIARNLAKAGFEVRGFDRNPPKRAALAGAGVTGAATAAEAAAGAEAVFIVVMDGAQAREVALGAGGIAPVMEPGSTVILCSTIRPAEAREIAAGLAEAGIDMIDCPVTGGRPAAESGRLTLMAAAPEPVLARCRAPLEAIAAQIYHAGTEAGQGQTVKACLTALVGAVIAGACEASALAAAAGIGGDLFQKVVGTSAAGSPVAEQAVGFVADRRFAGTGAHIDTQLKDLTITAELARELGVPMRLASAALELVQAGKNRFPDSDNWTIARLSEETTGVEFHRAGPKRRTS